MKLILEGSNSAEAISPLSSDIGLHLHLIWNMRGGLVDQLFCVFGGVEIAEIVIEQG